MRVHHAAVCDTEIVEPAGPLLELGTCLAAEPDVVEARPELGELTGGDGPVVLMDPEQRAVPERPHQMAVPAASVCSSRTGSAPISARYQGPLTSMSLTVTATWCSAEIAMEISCLIVRFHTTGLPCRARARISQR